MPPSYTFRAYRKLKRNGVLTQSFRYEAFFVIMWGAAILSIFAALGMAIWLLVSFFVYEDGHALRSTLTLLCIVALLFYTYILRKHGFRVMVRAGVFPFCCTGGVFPQSLDELKCVLLEYHRQKKHYTIVGGGWSHFLWRRIATGTRVFLHNFHGKRNGGEVWHSGTTIAEVQAQYKARGESLAHFPTMDYISIGAWVACFNHGNTGDKYKNLDRHPIKRVYIFNINSNKEFVYDLKSAQVLLATNTYISPNLVITGVEFNSVKDSQVQKRLVMVQNEETANQWLQDGAYLRMMFIGGTRDYAMALRWDDVYKPTQHKDPHFCSRMCLFLQTDVFSVVGGWHESPDNFTGISKLSDANKWTPPIYPFMTVAVILSRIVNFEVFFKINNTLCARDLAQFVQKAIRMHKEVGGRSEVRYDTQGEHTLLYWDISLSGNFDKPFRLLQTLEFNGCKVTHVALHPGKYHDVPVEPLLQVQPCVL